MSGARPSRRTVLRGAGVALALPWLESLAPRAARAASETPRRTFIAMSFPCGVGTFWRPAATGQGDAWQLSPVLAPLAPVKSHVSVLAGVGNYGPFNGHPEPAHSYLTGGLLTCARAKNDFADATKRSCGTSVDQVIARALGPSEKLDSLQVGLSTLDSSLDSLPPEYSRSISWRTPSQPLFKLVDPQAVYDKIVGAGGPGAPAFAAQRRAANRSMLDYLRAHATSVRARLGRGDRARYDEYLESVRALEKRVDTMAVPSAMCAGVARPPQSFGVGTVPPDYDRNVHADLMIDLVVMAIQCEVTRVVSFMLDDSRSDFVYSCLKQRSFTATGSAELTTPIANGLHSLSSSSADNSDWATINRWFVEKLSRLSQRLAAVTTPSGSLLDATTIWFGSEMNGGPHDALDLPMVVVGKGGGRLRTNQFIDFKATDRLAERLANLYLTFLRRVFDLPVETFGEGRPIAKAPANAYGAGTEIIPEILA